jgi:hypothetical protein
MVNSAAYDRFFGALSGCAFLAFISLCTEVTQADFIAGLLLILSGCVLSVMFDGGIRRVFGIISVFCITVALIFLIHFLMETTADTRLFLMALLNGAVSALLCGLFVPYVYRHRQNLRQETFAKFIKEDFSLMKLMKNFSKIDYAHAKKVSELCAECAKLCGAKTDVARMGGMYYRIGRMQGEPYVKNGVKLATTYNFPVEVKRILEEYNGEEHLPSTIESAIVHIVDCVVTKTELLDENTFSSTWNKEMLIYQTLNEKSSAGLYDNSGLSMNLFLKLREYLAKEGV